jgi:hypothetical protein
MIAASAVDLQQGVSAMLSKVVTVDALEGMKRSFANRRRWGEFVSAVQCSVSYPAVISALRSGAQWFNDGLQRVSARCSSGPHTSSR